MSIASSGAWPERTLVIAGPDSAETEQQILETAAAVAATGLVHYFRAGVWKTQTRPCGSSGRGPVALSWLEEARTRTGLAICTEVAMAAHVEAALGHHMDLLWIGASTTGNPYSVQELAEALKGVQVPVLVTNPSSPDLGLWLGALERLAAVGITELGAIHRGFAVASPDGNRCSPLWRIPIELARRLPGLQMVADPCSMATSLGTVAAAAQAALDCGLQGLMISTQADPDRATSHAECHIAPEELEPFLSTLIFRRPQSLNGSAELELEALRRQIDEVDASILDALKGRMDIVRLMAGAKIRGGLTALQMKRMKELLAQRSAMAELRGLPTPLVEELFQLLHEAAVKVQTDLMAAARNQPTSPLNRRNAPADQDHGNPAFLRGQPVDSPWVRPFGLAREAPGRLFCIPHAGGTVAVFNQWTRLLPPDIELCAIQLPGRGGRFAETAHTRLEPLVDELRAALLQGWLDRPFALFGHSLGALVAFELCRALRSDGGPLPRILFLSARRAPHIPPREPLLHRLPEAEFLDALRPLGGLPDEVIQAPALMELFVPVLRADFEVDETYAYRQEDPLDCPVSVFGGRGDPAASAAELDGWRQQTAASFGVRLFGGGHFYLESSRAPLLAELTSDLETAGLSAE